MTGHGTTKRGMKSFLLLALGVCALSLQGCGFSPLYGSSGAAGGQSRAAVPFTEIYIDNIPDREGQHLRNLLIDRFYRAGRPVNPAYTLAIGGLTEKLTELDITKTADTTRAQLRYTATLSLKDNASGRALLERELTAVTSYNILPSEFATRVSEDAARMSALEDLARQTEMQLALYFNRKP